MKPSSSDYSLIVSDLLATLSKGRLAAQEILNNQMNELVNGLINVNLLNQLINMNMESNMIAWLMIASFFFVDVRIQKGDEGEQH
jgi:hypothetical protein